MKREIKKEIVKKVHFNHGTGLYEISKYQIDDLTDELEKLFAIPVVSERTFRTNDPDVEDIAEQIDSFILMYWKTRKAGTYSLKLRKYIAATLNRYVR